MDTRWAVQIIMATDYPLTESVLVALAEDAEQWDAFVAARGLDGPGFTFSTESDDGDPLDAAKRVRDAALDLSAGSGILAKVVEVIVETPELADLHAFRPDTPELLASTDVAEVLGVSRQRVHQLAADHPDFPAPYARLGSGPIWTRPAIDRFAATWTRKPGRPAKAS